MENNGDRLMSKLKEMPKEINYYYFIHICTMYIMQYVLSYSLVNSFS